MRIIAGIAKGMPLVAANSSGLRPTADRIREAIFSSLGERVAGARVLDLFAGTGAIGLEAASRGAAEVIFVENTREMLDCLERNLETFKRNREVNCDFAIIHGDVDRQLHKLVSKGKLFSLIFADPPYGDAALQLLRDESLPRLLAEDGLFVLESAKRDTLTVDAPWQLRREAVYGDTRVSFLRMKR